MLPRTNFTTRAATTTEDIDKLCAVSDVIMSRTMLPFAKLLLLLLVLGLSLIQCRWGDYNCVSVTERYI